MILTVASLKGGAGKTTSVAFLAHALAERRRPVLMLDADPQASLMRWAEYAPGWVLPVELWPSDPRKAAARVRQIADLGWDVVIDTPPTDAGRARVTEALAVSTHLLVPVAPTPAEYERVAVMRELLDEAARFGTEITAGVLLVRAVAGAASTKVYRDLLTEDGWWVLRTTVRRLEVFAQAFADDVRRAAATAYGDAVAELLPALDAMERAEKEVPA